MVENNQDEIFNSVRHQVIEIQLTDENSFSRIAEVLTRTGIPSYKTNTLYQSVHILHKKHRYYIVHFKTMLALDGRHNELTTDDFDHVCTIADMLQQWGLCTVIDELNYNKTTVLVVPRKQRSQWKFVAKYNIGQHKSHQKVNYNE